MAKEQSYDVSISPSDSTTTTHPPTDQTTAISTQIDALLESYLGLLDTYTNIRASLSKELSTGFFSLAQAQRSSTLGAGRRYGEECYDERMQAQRVVSVSFDRVEAPGEVGEGGDRAAQGAVRLSVRRIEPTSAEKRSGADDTSTHSNDPKTHPKPASGSVSTTSSTAAREAVLTPAPGTTRTPSNTPPSTTTPLNPSSPTTVLKQTKTPNTDPLRWFGILTPTALRHSQDAFTTAVTGPIPDLITTSTHLLALEEQIRDLRSQLDSQLNDSQPQENENTESESTKGAKAAEKPSADATIPTASSPSKKSKNKTKSTLPSRPSEPRSRILKID